jgi:predicted ATP-binding protein involved in virulence
MKIRKLQLKNIGVFDDETIEFQPCPAKDKAEIHILTGENGSGKSTILQALASGFGDLVPYDGTIPRDEDYSEFSRVISHFNNSFAKRFHSLKNLVEIHFDSNLLPTIIDGFDNSWYSIKISYPIYIYSMLAKMGSAFDLNFAVFAFSGYRQIESESVQANYLPKNFNPLSQSLEFIKDYRKEGEITINQLIANNISNRALSKEDGSFEEAKKYETVINSIETFIKDITDYEVKFVLKRSPNEFKLKIHGEELDFDVLPDGLRSLISWIADLLGRVDLLEWQDDLPINEKNLILLLDEIEVHLHPAWQRKVLPVVQKLFKNSQIFVSTHSPFVVNSVDDAWVYKLELENGKAKVAEIVESENSHSISQVLRDVFGIDEKFGKEVQDKLNKFENLKDKILSNGSNVNDERELLNLAKSLADEPSDELKQIISDELRQLSKIKGKEYSL